MHLEQTFYSTMKRKSIRIFVLPVGLLLVLLQMGKAEPFTFDHLLTTYNLHSGRRSACPENLSYTEVTSDRPLMPAASMKAENHVCLGNGGKRLAKGSSVLSHGLKLPSLVTNPAVSFYAGVETDTRVCGPWAFNASSISWFILNNSDEDLLDFDTKITLQPGYIYVTYSHFSDVCIYRTRVEIPPRTPPSRDTAPETEADMEKPASTPPSRDTAPDTEVNAEQTAEMTNDEPACFPGNALVTVEGRGLIELRNVKVGDRVLASANGTFSEVFAFSHRDAFKRSAFVYIHTSSGKRLPLSPGHLLYLQGEPTTAKEARIGHSVMTMSGASEAIVKVEQLYLKGLYNPQTLNGNVVVNGVVTTTWTSAVPPITATSLLSPMRWLYRISPAKVSSFADGYLGVAIDQLRVAAPYTHVFTR